MAFRRLEKALPQTVTDVGGSSPPRRDIAGCSQASNMRAGGSAMVLIPRGFRGAQADKGQWEIKTRFCRPLRDMNGPKKICGPPSVLQRNLRKHLTSAQEMEGIRKENEQELYFTNESVQEVSLTKANLNHDVAWRMTLK